DPHQDASHRPITEEIQLAQDLAGVVLLAVVSLPGPGITPGAGLPERLHMVIATEMLTALQHCRYDWHGVCLPYGETDLAPGAQLEHIVRPAGLRARPHIGRLPAAERLSPHHSPSNGAVDIGVPHLDRVSPTRDLPVI